MRPRFIVSVALLGWCVVCPPSVGLAATPWQVDRERSRLVFVPSVAGGEFEGRFKSFDAAISFDPADLAGSHFTVDLDLAAAETGDAERDAALMGPDFFAVNRWPRARFTATRFKAIGGPRFEALGELRVRDVTRQVRVPFEFVPGPGAGDARLHGRTTIARLDFGVGQGDWRDTEWVANEVRIAFDLVLHRSR
jgi:polyisoprenoid-binding protein YceI